MLDKISLDKIKSGHIHFTKINVPRRKKNENLLLPEKIEREREKQEFLI